MDHVPDARGNMDRGRGVFLGGLARIHSPGVVSLDVGSPCVPAVLDAYGTRSIGCGDADWYHLRLRTDAHLAVLSGDPVHDLYLDFQGDLPGDVVRRYTRSVIR